MDDNSSILLNKAFNLHKAGNLEEAKFIYEKLYALDSNNPELINLYAQLSTSLQNYDFALELFAKLYDLTNIIDAKISIAKVYALKNDYSSAIDILLKLDCSNLEVMSLLVSCSMKLERYSDAKLILEDLVKKDNSYLNNYNLAFCYKVEYKVDKAIELMLPFEEDKSDNIQYLTFMGSLYRQLNQQENELFYLQKIGLLTNNTSVLNACSIIAVNLEKYDLALFYLNKILDIMPEHLDTMISIADVYRKIDLKISNELFLELHKNNPKNFNILFSLCSISKELHLFEEMNLYADKLASLENIQTSAYPLLAEVYYKLYKYEKALKYWSLAVEEFPDNYEFKAEKAEILSILGYTDEAREITKNILHVENALRTYAETFIRNQDIEPVRDMFLKIIDKPKDINTFLNRGKLASYKYNLFEKYSVSQQEFQKIGKETFEKNQDFQNELISKKLKDNDYKGKKILIYSGQGIGDMIMSLRYLNYLKSNSKDIILSVPSSLFDIVKYNFSEFSDIRIDMVDSLKEFSYVTPYLSLIYNLNLSLKQIPFSSGYLKVDDRLIRQKAKLELFNTNKKKIGIFWQGNPLLLYNRSAKLKHFMPLLNNEKLQLYSFQLEDIDDESKELLSSSPIIDLSPFIKNYSDTASFLFNVDVLVTIDTSIAHLAGALGIKTYLMLPYDSEWRWFYDIKTTPWYDSVTIFKQTIPNDWDEVIQRINETINYG